MFTTRFWKLAVERAVKSAAQLTVALIGAVQADWLTLDWSRIWVTAAVGAALSLVTSIASEPFGAANDPSVVR